MQQEMWNRSSWSSARNLDLKGKRFNRGGFLAVTRESVAAYDISCKLPERIDGAYSWGIGYQRSTEEESKRSPEANYSYGFIVPVQHFHQQQQQQQQLSDSLR
ncbi:hypothetical protein HGM15179_005356 [Zosterops borbonicus]|uniref:Eukaryotic glycogen debranching enzyme N-terminal domain-containing protein n=1 Tax=Zosterops borbonicus TaxID=364589 RepID=A0A8K1GQ95_9PASS|nr:hypothetical protein HGM15179_005356 [Zosterops borbonicus]